MASLPPLGRTPRLLLFDLDGTLLDPVRQISEANRRAIRSAMARGVRVGFATGRSRRSVWPWVEELQPSGPLILLNGAMVWDVAAARPLLERRLPRPDARAALSAAADLGVHANLYLGDDVVIAARSDTSRASEVKDGVGHTVVGDLLAHLDGQAAEPYKILCIDESGGIDALADRLRSVLTEGSVLVHSEPTYLEVLPPGVSKGAALQVALEHTGLEASQVVSFGDGLNDIELLEASGVGVAMANAHPGLRGYADLVIGSNDSDTIADFLSSHPAPD